MKKLFIAIVSITLSMGVVSFAKEKAEGAKPEKKKATPEEMFAKKDKDGDGKISVEEFVGKLTDDKAAKAKDAFTKKDKDGNGSLCVKEWTATGKGDSKKKKKADQ